MTVGLKPLLRASFAASCASRSAFPDSLAKRMARGSAARGGLSGHGLRKGLSIEPRQEAREPRPLGRRGGREDPVEAMALVVGERRRVREKDGC